MNKYILNKAIAIVGVLLCVIGITSLAYAATMAERLAGKILLQVEESGEAWYIHPDTHERYFLGRPTDAFELMRKLGLGIKNADLEQIPIAEDSPALPQNDEGEVLGAKVVAGECDCSSNIYNCSDFGNHDEAQALFKCCIEKVGSDVHVLDTDDDSLACESM